MGLSDFDSACTWLTRKGTAVRTLLQVPLHTCRGGPAHLLSREPLLLLGLLLGGFRSSCRGRISGRLGLSVCSGLLGRGLALAVHDLLLCRRLLTLCATPASQRQVWGRVGHVKRGCGLRHPRVQGSCRARVGPADSVQRHAAAACVRLGPCPCPALLAQPFGARRGTT